MLWNDEVWTEGFDELVPVEFTGVTAGLFTSGRLCLAVGGERVAFVAEVEEGVVDHGVGDGAGAPVAVRS